MKTLNTLLIAIITLSSISAFGQDKKADRKQLRLEKRANKVYYLKDSWQVGFGLGEIPLGGSFKPSLTFGYHFSDKIYAGVIYQFKDEISRNGTSFNADATGLDGLTKSSETVAQRFLLQARYTPVRYAPYISGGFVYNRRDTETMQFDARERTIGEETFDGTVAIQQSRPAGWGFALGLGYQYDFKCGFSINVEWTPAWFQYGTPEYNFSGDAALSETAQNQLRNQMTKDFKKSVTNLYKVFHIGVAYRIKYRKNAQK